MWTWERIIEFYTEIESEPRFEWDRINAHEMLQLSAGIRSCPGLEGIEPFLSLAALYLYIPRLDRSISLYSDSPGVCRVALHQGKSIDSIWVKSADSHDLVELILRIVNS